MAQTSKGQAGEGVLEDLLKAEELPDDAEGGDESLFSTISSIVSSSYLDDTQVDRGVKPKAT